MHSQNNIQRNKVNSIQDKKYNHDNYHNSNFNSHHAQNNQNHTNYNNFRKQISHFSYHLQNDLLFKSKYYSLYKGINETDHSKVYIKVIQIPKKPNPSSQNYINIQKNQQLKTKQYLMVQNQITTTKKLKHSKILKLIQNYSTQNNFYFVHQRFSNITLSRYIDQLKKQKLIVSFKTLQKVIKDTYQVLKYIIHVGYLFPSLSKHCILVNNQPNSSQKNVSCKITGIGYTLKTHHNQNFNSQVDLNINLLPQLDNSIISPQTLRNRKYTIQSQVWAFGVILYQSFIGRVPWKKEIFGNKQQQINVNQPNEKELKTIFNSIIQSNISKQIDKKIAPLIQQNEFKSNQMNLNFIKNLKDLIVNCLAINPESRINFSDIQKHPFFTKSNQIEIQTSNKSNKQLSTQCIDLKIIKQNVFQDKLQNQKYPPKNSYELKKHQFGSYDNKKQQKYQTFPTSHKYQLESPRKKTQKTFSNFPISKKLQKFYSSVKTQINYLNYLQKLNSLLSQFIGEKNQITLYSSSSQNRKVKNEILFNFQICLVKQILIQMYSLEKMFSQNSNQFHFDDQLWRTALGERTISIKDKNIWDDLKKTVQVFKEKFIKNQKMQQKYKKWIQSQRINNFKKLVTITNSNFDMKNYTQCEIASNYYLLKFIRSISGDLFLDNYSISIDLNSYEYRQKISSDSFFSSILLFDYLVSHYQILCLKFDDISAESFEQQSHLEEILQYFCSGQELLNFIRYEKNESSRKSIDRENKKYFMLSILRQEPISDRIKDLRKKISKLQLLQERYIQ